MTLWKPAPVPPSAKQLYLRIYIAMPKRSAREKLSNDLDARLKAISQEPVDPSGDFAVLASVLLNCCDLEDLVLEVVVRGQENIFGSGRES